jgi:hypothetical protein
VSEDRTAEEMTLLLESFVREMTKRGISVFGLAYRLEPEPLMAIIRNSTSDPVAEAESMTRIITSAVRDGRIRDHEVPPVN